MIELYEEGQSTVAEICKIYDISRPSFYNYLKNRKRELAKITVASSILHSVNPYARFNSESRHGVMNVLNFVHQKTGFLNAFTHLKPIMLKPRKTTLNFGSQFG